MSIPQGESSLLTPPAGVREVLTTTWRFWLWAGAPPPALSLLYITAVPEQLDAIGDAVSQALRQAGAPAPCAIRFVRSTAILANLNRWPDWAGKAITLYAAAASAPALAGELDRLLAGKGLSGPPVLRARPFGGGSGMLFLRVLEGEAKQSKLERLLAGTDG